MFHACSTWREINLVEPVGVGEQFVVIQLHKERDFVRVFAGHRAEHAQRGGDGVATAFHRELHDVFGVEIVRVFCKTRAGGMFDALVHRQDGHVTRAGQPAVAEQRLQAAQRLADCGRTTRKCGPRNPVPADAAAPSARFCIYVPGGLWRNRPKVFQFQHS